MKQKMCMETGSEITKAHTVCKVLGDGTLCDDLRLFVGAPIYAALLELQIEEQGIKDYAISRSSLSSVVYSDNVMYLSARQMELVMPWTKRTLDASILQTTNCIFSMGDEIH